MSEFEPNYPPTPEQLNSKEYSGAFGLDPTSGFDELVGFVALSDGHLRAYKRLDPNNRNSDRAIITFFDDGTITDEVSYHMTQRRLTSTRIPNELTRNDALRMAETGFQRMVRMARDCDDTDKAVSWLLDYY